MVNVCGIATANPSARVPFRVLGRYFNSMDCRSVHSISGVDIPKKANQTLTPAR